MFGSTATTDVKKSNRNKNWTSDVEEFKRNLKPVISRYPKSFIYRA